MTLMLLDTSAPLVDVTLKTSSIGYLPIMFMLDLSRRAIEKKSLFWEMGLLRGVRERQRAGRYGTLFGFWLKESNS